MKFEMNIKNLNDSMKKIQDGIIESTKEELLKTGAEAFEYSLKRVPVDTGRLRQSALMTVNSNTFLRGPKKNDEQLTTREYPIKRKLQNNITIVASYNTPYARIQHEEHKVLSKYLEDPMNDVFDINAVKKQLLKGGSEWAQKNMK